MVFLWLKASSVEEASQSPTRVAQCKIMTCHTIFCDGTPPSLALRRIRFCLKAYLGPGVWICRL